MLDQRKRLSRPSVVRLDLRRLAELEAVVEAIPRHRTTRRYPSPEESDVLRRYWGKRPIHRLAVALKVSENTMRRWAHEAGLLA